MSREQLQLQDSVRTVLYLKYVSSGKVPDVRSAESVSKNSDRRKINGTAHSS